MQIAIQGIKGSFHEIAAFKYFGEHFDLDMLECNSFPAMFRAFEEDTTTYGVMAIENTVAGTILPNYALLRNSEMRIIGEVYLRIEHHLMVFNGQDISQIKEVRSHPMAILQCEDFFSQYPHIKLSAMEDTALSAKQIMDQETVGVGAIASSLAADHYGLNILAKGIETNKRNFTRFLILQHESKIKPANRPPNRASICFHLSHKVGSLVEVLNILAKHDINLTKIQSLPVVGQVWEYFFHLDVEFEDKASFDSSIIAIQPYIEALKILGIYRTGIKHRTI